MKTTFTTAERAAFLAAHGNKCDNCGVTGVKLQAHHSSYEAVPDTCLCVKCHRRLHADRNRPIERPGNTRPFNILNIPDADIAALNELARNAGVSRNAYIVALIHTEAERIRAEMAAKQAAS